MLYELLIVGLFVGGVSGFFGVGGGMLLVPMLMFIGFGIKSAIAISIVQMVFSSVFGSYLSYRKGNLLLNEGIWIGLGGLIGGSIGARMTDILDKSTLEYVFLGLILFAIIRVSISGNKNDQEEGSLPAILLFSIGITIGIIGMMLGVGGAVMLTPILVGFLNFPSKKAATAGLFFVVFSSISGLGYKLFSGTFNDLSLDVSVVLSVSFAALLGVTIGLALKNRVKDNHHKRYLLALYLVIFSMLVKRIFLS